MHCDLSFVVRGEEQQVAIADRAWRPVPRCVPRLPTWQFGKSVGRVRPSRMSWLVATGTLWSPDLSTEEGRIAVGQDEGVRSITLVNGAAGASGRGAALGGWGTLIGVLVDSCCDRE